MRTGTGTSPWRLTTGDTLLCDAGATEQFIPERLFVDGTLTFDYRFLPDRQKTGYRGAVYVRRSQEGQGVRIDLGEAVCGTLTATVTGSSDREKKIEDRPAKRVANPVGEWNTVEIICEGKSVTVKVNGKPASSLNQGHRTGLIALAAEDRNGIPADAVEGREVAAISAFAAGSVGDDPVADAPGSRDQSSVLSSSAR